MLFQNWQNLQEAEREIAQAKRRGPVCETRDQFLRRIATMREVLRMERAWRKARRQRNAKAAKDAKRRRAENALWVKAVKDKRRATVKRIKELRRGKATNGPSAPAA